MKRLLLFILLSLTALTMNAQKCAVLEFQGARSVSVADVDGISEMFMTYFRPAGYTMVERAQIDRVISEQGFQYSSITDAQAVKLGRILNVSKVVLGKVSKLGGQYQVDVRVVDVQSGHDVALEGATFSGDYRTNVRNLATKLASKIAITPGSTVAPAATAKTRSSVEVVYGYLKVFPKELGEFQSEPTSVIAQINRQAQHGYNNWRIPTNEELSLLRANNYLGSGKYMTRESKNGIVLLVTDGDDYQTIKRAEQERKAAEERRAAELKARGFVDLGLPSGTLWKNKNEEGGFYTYEQALNKYGNRLPTNEQFEELKKKCSWSWTGSGYKVTGPNGNSIVLPAAGYRYCSGGVDGVGSGGDYWSATPDGSDSARYLSFGSGGVNMSNYNRCDGQSVRLVQD